MKKILTLLSSLKSDAELLRFSDGLSSKYNSKIDYTYLSNDYEQIAKFTFCASISSNSIYEEFKKSYEHDFLTKLRVVETRFNSNIKNDSAKFVHEEGHVNDIISSIGKFYDSIIIPSNIESNKDYNGLINTVIFETGSPVIIAPETAEFKGFKNILIAWDGSIRASKAVKSSLEILKCAKQVFVVGVNESEKDIASADQLIEYLSPHGVNAKHLGIKKVDFCVGKTLCNEAEKQNCDLIIMGAYNHNRVRQMILGGATKFMLNNSKIATLMQH